VVPLVGFGQAMRSSDRRRRSLGATGVVVLVAFAVFGLTEATLENLVPITLLAVFLAALCSELDADDSQPTDSTDELDELDDRWRRPQWTQRDRTLMPLAYRWGTPFGTHY